MKSRLIICALILAMALPGSAAACSVAGCPNDGTELRSNVVAIVTHQGKPLSGVTIQMTRRGVQVFFGKTEPDGSVHISNLTVGEYWLSAELLGISAAHTCFHVSPHASRKAKKKLKFEWGDMPTATRQIAGRAQISELGKQGSLVWRVQHRLNVPIRNASLILQSPVSDAIYRAVSDRDGGFSFAEIPSGIYVLHVKGGATPDGDVFGPDDFVLQLSPSAKSEGLVLTPNVGGGSCGGWSLTPR
jgi:hypothetical protein